MKDLNSILEIGKKHYIRHKKIPDNTHENICYVLPYIYCTFELSSYSNEKVSRY